MKRDLVRLLPIPLALSVASALGCSEPGSSPTPDAGVLDGGASSDAAAPADAAGWCRPPLGALPAIGWDAAELLPTYRAVSVAATAGDGRIALVWNHQARDPRVSNPDEAFLDGLPTAYASVVDLARGVASAPQVVGTPPFPEAPNCLGSADDPPHYNTNHNTPLVLTTPSGSFLSLALPMNANGYAQCQASERLYHYLVSDSAAGSASWSSPTLAVSGNPAVGISMHEYDGTIDGDGTVHLFGQWQLGAQSGGAGYLRRRGGDPFWYGYGIAEYYRPAGLNYMAASVGAVARTRNAQGKFDLHLAFEWNRQGDYPRFGLHYLVSHDGGDTWASADGATQFDFRTQPSLTPAQADASIAIIPANLSTSAYSGDGPASELGLSIAVAPDGAPVILRLDCQAPDCAGGSAQLGTTQAHVWTWLDANKSWLQVPVGPPLHFYTLGTSVSVRNDTGNVNVVLLDDGYAADGTKHPARVLRYVESVADLRAGRSSWSEEVIATIQTTSFADRLRVTVVPDCRLEILVDGSDAYQLVPRLFEAAMQ